MKNSVLYLFLFIAAIALSSCSKDDDNNTELTVEEMLTAHNWVKQSISYTESDQDVTNQYETIFQDIHIKFNTDGTYSIRSSSLGVLSSGTWSINDAGDVITVIDQDNNTIIINILSISETSLHVTFTYTNTVFITVTVDIDVSLIPDTA